jgi:lysophospholipase L1-like esterase
MKIRPSKPDFDSPLKVAGVVAVVLLAMGALTALWPERNPQIGSWEIKWKSWNALWQKDTLSEVDLAAMEKERVADSIRLSSLQGAQDSLNLVLELKAKDPAQLHIPQKKPDVLNAFFQQLDSLEKGQRPAPFVRIMHWGDSQIEIDRISDVLRNELQAQFGGIGPGLLPIQQTIPTATVGQTENGSLRRYLLWGPPSGRHAAHRSYGPLLSFSKMDSGRVELRFSKGMSATAASGTFSKVVLLTGHRNSDLQVSASTGFSQTLPAGPGLQSAAIKTGEPLKQISISLQSDSGAVLYGISLTGSSGVVVDNLPMRGCSGTIFTGTDAASMAQGLKALDADVLLMEFGGNMIPSLSGEYSAQQYAATMGKQIDFLKRNSRNLPIVFMGPSDMAIFKAGNWQTHPLLPQFVQILKDTVLAHGAVYFDMMAAMGGSQSMVAWVKASPQLAVGDYIHFSNRGARKMGQIFHAALMKEYQLYQLKKRVKTIQKK